MWPLKRFVVRKHERGLLYKDGDFVRFLWPSTYLLLDTLRRYELERYSVTEPAFEHPLADYFVECERSTAHRIFEVVETGADEVAVVYHDERVAAVLGPGERKLYWRGVVQIRIERFDLGTGPAITPELAKRLVAGPEGRVVEAAERAVYASLVPEGAAGLLYVNGELAETLPAGLHLYWRFGRVVRVEVVDLRTRTLEVRAQEVVAKDNSTLRVGVLVSYRVAEPAKAVRAAQALLDHACAEIRLALRAAVGTRTLDAVLADQAAIDRDLAAHLRFRFGSIGLALVSLGVQEIAIVPGEAKLVLDTLGRRLWELGALDHHSARIGTLSVRGGLDAVLTGLIRVSQ